MLKTNKCPDINPVLGICCDEMNRAYSKLTNQIHVSIEKFRLLGNVINTANAIQRKAKFKISPDPKTRGYHSGFKSKFQ